MGKHIWGYWDCPYCGNKGIRGDNTHCPGCGNPVPPDTKFYIRQNVREEVDDAHKSSEANWICEYCSAQNSAADTVCKNCGSPKSEAERDYFGTPMNAAAVPPPVQNESPHTGPYENSAGKKKKKILKSLAFVFLVIGFFVWLFKPITRTSDIQGFEWNRSIEIEEFRNVDESSWSLPSGANLHYTKLEISHYVQVLDHYEQRTRMVSHREPDGYDVSYRDLGNGQFEEVETPRYKTVWEEETYDEPVYRSDPVYETKYYYDIDKWIKVDSAASAGADHEPYWADTGLQANVDSPQYGDKREGERKEEYYALVKDKKGNVRKVAYSYSEWEKLSEGDVISYLTHRFSYEPLD